MNFPAAVRRSQPARAEVRVYPNLFDERKNVAALFLRRFVTAAKAWLHCDIFAWNPATKPGRPEGAECQGARALYHLLMARYG